MGAGTFARGPFVAGLVECTERATRSVLGLHCASASCGHDRVRDARGRKARGVANTSPLILESREGGS